jgi:hypothetical protein
MPSSMRRSTYVIGYPQDCGTHVYHHNKAGGTIRDALTTAGLAFVTNIGTHPGLGPHLPHRPTRSPDDKRGATNEQTVCYTANARSDPQGTYTSTTTATIGDKRTFTNTPTRLRQAVLHNRWHDKSMVGVQPWRSILQKAAYPNDVKIRYAILHLPDTAQLGHML